jgi:hypothetical protein
MLDVPVTNQLRGFEVARVTARDEIGVHEHGIDNVVDQPRGAVQLEGRLEKFNVPVGSGRRRPRLITWVGIPLVQYTVTTAGFR